MPATNPESIGRIGLAVRGGWPDVARALVAAGVCKRPDEAFARFLGDRGPAYVGVESITLEEALAMGRAAGARMSIAHPHTLGKYGVVRDAYQRLRSEGLEGIEALYGRYSRAASRGWLQLADELDLVATSGSDFHGGMLPDVVRPVVDLPEPYVRPLCEWLGVEPLAAG